MSDPIMSSIISSSSSAIPPIPPPLPVVTKSERLSKNKSLSDSNTTKQKFDGMKNLDEISKTCSLYWNYMTLNLEEFVIISVCNEVESIIQDGPKCGLVALAMSQSLVSNQLPLNQNDFYQLAKQLGFTNKGEMFSVSDMAKLAIKALSVRAEVKTNLKEHLYELLVHLGKGLPVLIPYDSDGNHEPTLKSGQRAHWAILLGFCIAIDRNHLSNNESACNIDQHNPQLIHLTPKQSLPKFLLDIILNQSYKQIFIYAKQGKSKHLHLWNFEKLCESNSNLVETSHQLESDMILPSNGGIIIGLNNQSLFINSQNCFHN